MLSEELTERHIKLLGVESSAYPLEYGRFVQVTLIGLHHYAFFLGTIRFVLVWWDTQYRDNRYSSRER